MRTAERSTMRAMVRATVRATVRAQRGWVLVVAALALGMTTAARAQLVVNEIDYDQSGADGAEFVEVKNVSGAPVELSDYELQLVNGTNAEPYETIALPGGPLVPGGFFVVCGDSAVVDLCDLDVEPDSNLIQNGAPDAVALIRTVDGAVIDTVSYEGDVDPPYTEGSGVGLEDDSAVEGAGVSRFPDGIDSDLNNVDLSLRCSTPGTANVASDADCSGGGGVLAIDGDCPGEISLTYTGGTPGGVAGFVVSFDVGADPLAAGPCAGTPTELLAPQLLSLATLDENGSLTLMRNASEGSCGAWLQVVDGATCEVSSLASVP